MVAKDHAPPGANLARDGLQIPAVTSTDVKHCELALRAKLLPNEAAFFGSLVVAQIWKGCVARFGSVMKAQ